jgi:DNA end-binding protein Ku
MPRPAWTGSISFGLVNIPVRMFSAIESHRVSFHELERGTGQRIRYRRIAAGTGHEVPWDKVQKGFEIAKDRFVVLTDEEMEAAEPRRTHTVDVERFVPLGDIDPVTWADSYYVAPDGTAATKAYVLLRDAMRREGRVAIGRFVLRTKEYVVCIRPFDDALALHTLYFADEVRDVKDVVKLPAHAAVSASELDLAARLIESLSGAWRPRELEDTFRQRILALVKKKERGETIEAGAERAEGPRVVDLMEALKATLAKTANGHRPRTHGAPAVSRGEARVRAKTSPARGAGHERSRR